MSNIKKLSGFRQLSLNCEYPNSHPALTKQFSQDLSSWQDEIGMKISLNQKPIKNPFVKTIWQDITKKNDPLMIKTPAGGSKKDENLEGTLLKKPQDEKRNLKIVLTNHDNFQDDYKDEINQNDAEPFFSKRLHESTKILEDSSIKREMFRKRTNSAFNKDISKTKRIVRMNSAPSRTKIINKNKISKKTTPKNPCKDENVEEQSKTKNAEIVTMVSLISPSDSDEELDELKKQEDKEIFEKILEEKPPMRIQCLRKAAKSVSFQQSSIHAIRSFSASFPARRTSVSAAMMLNNMNNHDALLTNKPNTRKSSNKAHVLDNVSNHMGNVSHNIVDNSTPKNFDKIPVPDFDNVVVQDVDTDAGLVSTTPQEKRGTKSDASEEVRKKSKRRFLKSFTFDNSDSYDQHQQEIIASTAFVALESESETQPDTSQFVKPACPQDPQSPDLKSEKEKQCWNMYCKLSKKGIKISLDTILRGILTPTEYRASQKNLLHQQIDE